MSEKTVAALEAEVSAYQAAVKKMEEQIADLQSQNAALEAKIQQLQNVSQEAPGLPTVTVNNKKYTLTLPKFTYPGVQGDIDAARINEDKALATQLLKDAPHIFAAE